ncbi:hypothetical protein ACERII_13535 [Evansella sp. AB-rgal1]|uniref:hypothetical protein n=1 Tax=Evansella sp. AB-rgal1 TaxID=3242696 RepID=UPI00359E704D
MNQMETERLMSMLSIYERRGREIGRQEGRNLGLIEVAKRMLEKGMKKEEVLELTGLSEEMLNELVRDYSLR